MNSSRSFDRIIRFVIDQLNIHFISDVLRQWDKILDWFFYFNKTTGCGIPNANDFWRYL